VMISIVLVLEPGLNFFLVGLAYVGSGPAGYLFRWRTGRELLRVDGDEMPEPEADESGSAQTQGANPSGSGTQNVTSLPDH
jgi:hypothetical protein